MLFNTNKHTTKEEAAGTEGKDCAHAHMPTHVQTTDLWICSVSDSTRPALPVVGACMHKRTVCACKSERVSG